MARQILGCYRKDDAADAEQFVAACAAILAEYPDDIVQLVCDPRTGIARDLKWLPSVAEVNAACEKEVQRKARLSEPRREPVYRPAYTARTPEQKMQQEANVFCVNSNLFYARLVAKHEATGGRESYLGQSQNFHQDKGYGIYFPAAWGSPRVMPSAYASPAPAPAPEKKEAAEAAPTVEGFFEDAGFV